MVLAGDRVPMFKLRPYRSLIVGAILVFIVGGLLSAHWYIEDAYVDSSRATLILIITVVLTLLLLIAAFSRFLMRHLWHHRPGYKRG